jgi:tetratricopeptide (TPR) repeat protein
MYVSVGIFAVSIVAIGGFSIYQNWIMPAPVELGASTLDIPAIPMAPAPVAVLPQAFLVHGSASAEQAPAVETETQLSAATNATTAPSANAPPQQPAAPTPAAASAAPALAQARTLAPSVASELVVPAADNATTTATTTTTPAPKPTAPTAAAVAAAPTATTGVQFASALLPAAAAKPVEAAPAITQHAVPVSAAKAQLAVKAESDAPTDEEEAPSASGGPTYDELVSVGRALSKKNRRVEASEAFRRALVQSPQGSAALSGLGFVYLNADERQNAKEFAQRAVQADASNAEGWIVLGAALEMLGDRAGAKDAYRNCVERGQGPYLNECRRVAR